MRNVLIVGASRGLGLGFTLHYVMRNWCVYATIRQNTPRSLILEKYQHHVFYPYLELRDEASRYALAETMKNIPLDLLICNAGVGEGEDMFLINSALQIVIADLLVPSLLLAEQPKLIFISSTGGSTRKIETHKGELVYFLETESEESLTEYRKSKIELNKNFRENYKRWKFQGITAVLLGPERMKTEMTGLEGKPPGDSARKIINVIDTLTVEDSGKFLSWDGEILPW